MRKHNYFCGYLGDKQVVYGKDYKGEAHRKNWIEPMTLTQAKLYAFKVNKLWNLTKEKEKMVVYELKQVKS